MADPIIPDHYRAMMIFQGISGLPEDRFVNTFFFRGDGIGTFPAVTDNIATVLTAFFNKLQTNGAKLGSFIAGGQLASAELRCYELAETPPRTPETREMTIDWGTGGSLPAEVSLCLSYRTTRKGPRGRGRVYLGPLTSSTSVVLEGRVRPGPTVRETAVLAAADMLATTENVTWVGLSKADGQTYEVAGGFCDDAFDTQRRRGPAPTSRNFFGNMIPPA